MTRGLSVGLLAGAALALGLVAACFEVPEPQGLFRCEDQQGCPGDTLCDDGVCCRPLGDPVCLSYVLDGGRCADGGLPTFYFPDNDGDGFGAGKKVAFCAKPAMQKVADNSQDCNDDPSSGGEAVYPGHPELCDGLDNDCNGDLDEGQSRVPWYEDVDKDGYGDPAHSRQACMAPRGLGADYVKDNTDCDPIDGNIHPGDFALLEVCNGKDDNCDSIKDNIAPLPCSVTGKQGECAKGQYGCTGLSRVCQQTAQPSQDLCDGKDNNCDGNVDERPECRGPANLLADATVSRGAPATGQIFNGYPTSCAKDLSGWTAESFSGGVWSGSGNHSHVLYFEATGRPWDLSNPALTLKLDFSHTSSGWSSHSQPVILLCNPAGTQYIRLVHNPTTAYLMATASGSVSTTIQPAYAGVIPTDGGALTPDPWGWVRGVGSTTSPDFLKSVSRVEIMVQPSSGSFTVTPTRFSIE